MAAKPRKDRRPATAAENGEPWSWTTVGEPEFANGLFAEGLIYWGVSVQAVGEKFVLVIFPGGTKILQRSQCEFVRFRAESLKALFSCNVAHRIKT